MPNAEDKMLAKVQALLAKAESTPYPEEAAAFVAKAQELMTRYAIDEVLATSRSRRSRREAGHATDHDRRSVPQRQAIAARRRGGRQRRARRHRTNRVDHGSSDSSPTSTSPRLLFASLLVQATREMHMAATRITDGRLRAFRHAFFVSYGSRIGARLDEARAAATEPRPRRSTAAALGAVVGRPGRGG